MILVLLLSFKCVMVFGFIFGIINGILFVMRNAFELFIMKYFFFIVIGLNFFEIDFFVENNVIFCLLNEFFVSFFTTYVSSSKFIFDFAFRVFVSIFILLYGKFFFLSMCRNFCLIVFVIFVMIIFGLFVVCFVLMCIVFCVLCVFCVIFFVVVFSVFVFVICVFVFVVVCIVVVCLFFVFCWCLLWCVGVCCIVCVLFFFWGFLMCVDFCYMRVFFDVCCVRVFFDVCELNELNFVCEGVM